MKQTLFATCDVLPLSDLLQVFATRRATCTLIVKFAKGSLRFTIVNGQLVTRDRDTLLENLMRSEREGQSTTYEKGVDDQVATLGARFDVQGMLLEVARRVDEEEKRS